MDYALTESHVSHTGPAEMREIDARIAANRTNWTIRRAYEATIFEAQNRQNFQAYERARAAYFAAQENVVRASAEERSEDARALNRSELQPAFERARAAIQAILAYNSSSAVAAVVRMQSVVRTTLITIKGRDAKPPGFWANGDRAHGRVRGRWHGRG